MIGFSIEMEIDDDVMAAIGIWVLVSLVILISVVAMLYYLRYVRTTRFDSIFSSIC